METFEEFKAIAREKYKEFDSDAEWLDYIYSYALEHRGYIVFKKMKMQIVANAY